MTPAFRSPFRRQGSAADRGDEVGPGDEIAAEGVGPGDEASAEAAEREGEWVAYELHEWASEPRRMLAQLVVADSLPHSWQGTTLLVHEDHEDAVDALVEEVELATAQRLEPDEDLVAFEMTGWSEDLQAELVSRLGSAGVPHEIDADGDLVVRELDEEHVELLIEDLIARAGEDGLDELDGLDVNSLMSDLFVACDRLRRDVHDADGVLSAVRHGRRLAGIRTPYGFAAITWRDLRSRSAELVEMLEEGDVDDEELRSHAHELRDVLHRLI